MAIHNFNKIFWWTWGALTWSCPQPPEQYMEGSWIWSTLESGIHGLGKIPICHSIMNVLLMWYHQLDDIHPVLQKQPKAATDTMSKEAKELCWLEHSQYNDYVALYVARFDNRNWFWLLDLVLKKVGPKLEGIMVKFNSPEVRVSVLCEWLWTWLTTLLTGGWSLLLLWLGLCYHRW